MTHITVTRSLTARSMVTYSNHDDEAPCLCLSILTPGSASTCASATIHAKLTLRIAVLLQGRLSRTSTSARKQQRSRIQERRA